MPSPFALNLAIKKLATLTSGGYRHSPSQESRDKAVQLVAHLADLGFTKTHISPMADGGISIYLDLESGGELRFSIENDETEMAIVFRVDDTSNREYDTVSSVEEAVKLLQLRLT